MENKSKTVLEKFREPQISVILRIPTCRETKNPFSFLKNKGWICRCTVPLFGMPLQRNAKGGTSRTAGLRFAQNDAYQIVFTLFMLVCLTLLSQGRIFSHPKRATFSPSMPVRERTPSAATSTGTSAEHLGRCIYGGIWVGEESDIPNTRGIRNDVVSA